MDFSGIKKRLVSGMFLCSVLTVAAQPAIVENIAIGKPVSSNVDNLSHREPAKALDGSVNYTDSKWTGTGESSVPQWLTVDLQNNFTIARYVVKHAGCGNEDASLNTCNFEILKSNDGINYTPVDKVRGNRADITDKDVRPFNARYVRLQITRPQQGNGNQSNIYEFELYEKPRRQISGKSFYATEGFERFSSTKHLKEYYAVSSGDISLKLLGKTKVLKLDYNGQAKVSVKLPDVTDLSKYTVLGIDFCFPADATRPQVKDSETLYVSFTDTDNKTAIVQYPFDNSIWMTDGRPWVSWHINMKDMSAVDLKSIKNINIGLNAKGSGSFLIDNISFERQKYILDFTKIIKTDRITEEESIIRKPSGHRGVCWGTSILKIDTVYYLFNAWWSKGKDFDTGGIELFRSNNLYGGYTYVNEPLPRDFMTSVPLWGNYAHNPDAVKFGDTYYLYHISGRSSDRGGKILSIGVAWSKNVTGPWNFHHGPLITATLPGMPEDDDSFKGCTCFGVENPRVIEKDGEYYMFYKTSQTFHRGHGEGTEGRDGKDGYYIGYTVVKSNSPVGPLIPVRNSGLRGRGMQYDLYPTVTDVKAEGKSGEYSNPGNWDVEDMMLFRYIDGRYYAILKDFMGYWNRS
ncbi:MAG: discoidin domain-containing protein, partial [Dysgonamonadaceae bacterium]|nr:discoidin domain-containing protein [Dysgonamonadaceae bacterium]